MRTEHDSIGSRQLDYETLYGIHSLRAKENFPDSTAFQLEWYKAVGLVKLACYQTYRQYKQALLSKHNISEIPFQLIDNHIIDFLEQAAIEVSQGKYFEHFVVPAIQGGAGTSINMNINEIITNVALLKLGKQTGDYQYIDPIEHANIYQSTNDVIPTSLKLCVIQQLTILERKINASRAECEKLEQQHRYSLRVGYTQMQEAVPTSFGRLFSTYSEALSRDWWRISKCFERIKIVNLGGSAIGTGITVPRFFIMEVAQTLQRITNQPLTRAENMSDATSNLDSLVEVHAVIKAHAVNLEKMTNDLRLLSSDISAKYMQIPDKQTGSSIMPGKVNPVITEFVISACHRVYANDSLITSLSAQGCLELNAYLPVIGHAMIESLKLLIAANKTMTINLLNDIVIDTQSSENKLISSSATTTALVPYIGYHQAAELAKCMKNNKIDIFEANDKLKLIDTEKLKDILKPENLLKEGFTLNDLK